LPSLPVGTRIADYEIHQRIGEGAMSEVFAAVHRQIGRRVAIKVLNQRLFADPEAMERFTSEARAAAEIHHPNIVDVFGFGHFDDGRAYIIMEWLRGESLGARLARGPIPITDALELVLQMTGALRAAHNQDIIHRDLKPENVFLHDVKDEKPVVKVLDFGLAKRVRGARSLTLEGQLLGTPLYMSPEQCRGRDVDHRTDIYALGCIWYQMLTGRPPFDVESVAELVMAHLTERPLPLFDVPPSLNALVMNMLAKDPQQRPDLGEVRRTVQGLLGMQTGAMPAVQLEAFDETPIAIQVPERATRDCKPLTRRTSRPSAEFEHLESDLGETCRLTRHETESVKRALATRDAEPASSRMIVWILIVTLAAAVATLIALLA